MPLAPPPRSYGPLRFTPAPLCAAIWFDRYEDVAPHAKKWAFKTSPGPSGELVIQVEHKEQTISLTTEQVVGIMLERMRDTASGA